ncbi:8223_t:CDS:2, partial [Cetraspora pellucida]
MSQNNLLYDLNLSDIDVSSLAGLASLFRVADEPKCPEVRIAESIKLHDYIDMSYKGNILPYNKETQQMLRLEEEKVLLPSLTKVEDVDDLVNRLNDIKISDEKEDYPSGIAIQIVTRFLAYSLQFRRSISSVPTERLPSAVSAVSDYRSALIDLSNPFTTIPCKVLVSDFLGKAQQLMKLAFNPYTDPTGDIKAAINGVAPFQITGGTIQPYDSEETFIENLYRQAAGQFKSFDKAAHIAGTITPFGFKEYV